MLEIALARRYAQALVEIAIEKQAVEQFQTELNVVVDACRQHPQLRRLLEHPRVPEEDKKSIVLRVFYKHVSGAMISFLNLLIEKRRIQFLPEIRSQYDRLADEYTGVVHAEVRTPYPLTEAQKQRLIEVLCSYTGRRVLLVPQIAPDVIGGIWVRMKDTVLDGSAAGYIKRLRDKLLSRDVMFGDR